MTRKIVRKTEVVSISLPKEVATMLQTYSKVKNQTKSAYLSFLIKKDANDAEWEELYRMGARTAKKFRINSEDDIDRIIHAS